MAAIDLHLLTVDEAASRVGVHRQTITRAADQGRLPEVRTSGHLRYRLYFIHDIDKWSATRVADLSDNNRLRAERKAQLAQEHNPHAAQATDGTESRRR